MKHKSSNEVFTGILSAEVRIYVKCSIEDDTVLPGDFCLALSDPDEDDILTYTVSGFVTKEQLKQIYKILESNRESKIQTR